jgi:hypothetical protein
MTEEEWHHSTKIIPMVQYIFQRNRVDVLEGKPAGVFSANRWGKLTGEVLRQIRHLVDDPRLQQAITIVESCLEGSADREERHAAMGMAQQVKNELLQRDDPYGFHYSVASAIIYVSGFLNLMNPGHYLDITGAIVHHFSGKYLDEAKQCQFIRCVFGNPFRPVAFPASWLTTDVVTVALQIHNERRFEDLPILADALEEAACTNEDILRHCRTSAAHVRGCWVISGLLGKE